VKYSFENLEVWQKSRELVKEVYRVTSDFPADEKFGLTSQLRRAAVSVSSNIAEGSSRWSKKDQARFYEIAFGSLIEILNQSILSNDLEFMESTKLQDIRNNIDSIGRMLNSLYKAAKGNNIPTRAKTQKIISKISSTNKA
jgi:four helix bundle protein